MNITSRRYKGSKIITAIVLPDMQVPYEDKRTMKAVEKFMKTRKWDYYINLGDFMDLDVVSSHSAGKLRQVEGKRLKIDYDKGNKVLDRHQKIVKANNKRAKFVLLEGNHEFRIERYLDINPAGQGYLEVENALKLKERGFKYVRCYKTGETFKLGHAYFHHGLYCNDAHAKKHVMHFGKNIFYGHLHDIQSYTIVQHGDGNSLVGQSLGCLCEYEQSYIKGNPKKWQQAFAIFQFFPDGTFTYNVIRIFNHRFVAPDGRVYEG